jgi:hypothetical protein
LGVLLTIVWVIEQISTTFHGALRVLLPILVVLLLTGCGQQSEGNPNLESSPGSEIAINPTEGATAKLALDCSTATTVSVTVEEGRAYSPGQQIPLLVDEPVRIVVQSDEVTTIDLRGSETYSVVEIEPGLSSVCTTYRQTGQYPVQVGNLIPLVFVVD